MGVIDFARIGAALGVAFFGTASLAAAAAPISEQPIDVVPASANSVPYAEVERRKGAEAFLTALDRYDRAVQSRVLSQSAESDRALRDAEQALQNERDKLLGHLEGRSNGREVQKFKLTVQSHKSVGAALVQSADEARELLIDYSARYNAMRTRVRSSIDRAWKIFGHVVARQSLITLNRQVEELGAHSMGGLAFISGGDIESSSVARASEQAIATTLVDNDRSLAKSQGKEWVTLMRDDLASLSATRASLLKLHDRQLGLLDQLALTRTQVNVPSVASIHVPAIAVQDVHRQAPPTVDDALPQVSAPVSKSPLPPPPTAPARLTTDKRGTIIGLLGGGVLLLLVAISALIVRRVVGRVGSLVNAPRRIDHQMEEPTRMAGDEAIAMGAIAFNATAEPVVQVEREKREHQSGLGLEATFDDRTEQLEHLASNDQPCLLPNHRQLFTLLSQALDRAEKANTMVGVYILEIDNVSSLDDGAARPLEGEAAQVMSQRLQTVASEFGFAVRLSGDEFAVVFDHATSIEEIHEAGARLVRLFDPQHTVDSCDLGVTISVGASVFPEHARAPEALLREADAALFCAKTLGCGQLNMYSPDLLEAASAKFAIEQDLRRALERGEFELVDQRDVGLEGREVEFVEPLIRWRGQDGTSASVDQFLSVGEQSGLVADINDWATHSAVATSARWHFGRTLASLLMINRDS